MLFSGDDIVYHNKKPLMSKEISFFNLSIKKILSPDQSILDQARIRLLYYGFLIIAVAVFGLLTSVFFQHQILLTVTAAILFVSILFLFKYLTYKPNWRKVSHALLILVTLANLNNVFIALQNVDIITVQVIILVILFSFYMLGEQWGLWYSFLNVVPVLFFLIFKYNDDYFIGLRPERIDRSTLFISEFSNFFIILYIHNQLYNAFYNNNQQLKATSEEQLILNTQLELAIKKAEKSSQIKSEFLSTMSHEIRTPLNAVIGMSNLMLMSNPRPDQEENLKVLKFAANNLMVIVNDVLDFNKIESGKVEFESVSFSLTELIQNICGAQIAIANEKGLNFNLEIDASLNNKVLLGDTKSLTQILYNLVSNAIKFTHKGSVWLLVYCVEDREKNVTVNFTVKDTGIGIQKSKLESIFEPFIQESITVTRQYGGTGLGLAIVKRLLELQGGIHINVESKIGEGSAFSFNMDFPVSIEAVEKVTEPNLVVHHNDSTEALRVLIAEDNPVNVLLMKKLLSKWNIVPEIAENGARAVEALQHGTFDIILMDLQMPVLNGFDASMAIRKLKDLKKAATPIIALTASALNDIKEKVFNAGMNDYVSKPFKPEELIQKIKRLVYITH